MDIKYGPPYFTFWILQCGFYICALWLEDQVGFEFTVKLNVPLWVNAAVS